jgi:ABC-type sugar transport system ATPase subunit
MVNELKIQGKGVVFVSSELPELLRCSDRILVLRREGKQAFSKLLRRPRKRYSN